LHAHSDLSDGTGTPQEAFRYAREVAGLDFFALTDHSEYFSETGSAYHDPTSLDLHTYNSLSPVWREGQAQAQAATRDGEFVALFGYEMTWADGVFGHINTLFTGGFVSVNNHMLNNPQEDAGLLAYYDLLKRTPGSVSMFNHPGSYYGNFNDFAHIDPQIAERITLIEVSNGDGCVSDEGQSYFRTFWQYNLALDKGWYVAPVMSQDNHNGDWGTSNTVRTAVLAPALTAEHVQEALLNRRVYAAETEGVEIIFTANGCHMGSIVEELPDEINFYASIRNQSRENRIARVYLVTNGGHVILADTPGTRNHTYKKRLEKPEPGYYYLRVEIDTPQGLRYALTAPVFFGTNTGDTAR
jgi:histidinol phosphatase-like PHP family hydrolase